MSRTYLFLKNKLNLVTGWREYPYAYSEKKEKDKKANRIKTQEKRKLKTN